MANNHQGDINHGIKIIREIGKIARKNSIKAGVKFQYRNLECFIHPSHLIETKNKHIPRFLNTKLTSAEFMTMIEVIKDEGLISICTPFDEESVNQVMDHGIQIIKIASCSANDWPLLEAISTIKKPVVASTGGLNLTQIDNLVSFFSHRNVDFALLHCVGIYPTPNDKINMNFISKLKNRFYNIAIGYSGHENPDNYDVVKVAISKGANILERHVGLSTENIKLNAYSLNPEQVQRYVESSLIAYEICGESQEKRITQEEIDSLNSLKRGVFSRSEIKKGESIDKSKVFFAFPSDDKQTTTFDYHVTMIASKNYSKNEPIEEERLVRNRIDLIRSIVHEVKGMLNESKIVIGNEVKIELSHHYGIEHFRRFGAVIIDVINRSYCKKILVVLPGQYHPKHYHKIKEESFQLLSGDLEIMLGNVKKNLIPGDIFLIEIGIPHSFSSINGAIFEEVSTTHIKGDSVYEDEEINKKDLIERKTVLENW